MVEFHSFVQFYIFILCCAFQTNGLTPGFQVFFSTDVTLHNN